MNSDPLIKALIAAMMMLEESGTDEVNPDTAVQALENMGYELMKLTGDDRDEFLRSIHRLASTASDPHDAEFIRKLPFAIGMSEDL